MKKLKLLFSILTVCLSMAVLCFGVLAATSVSYNLGGSVIYEVKDVFATVTTRVYTSNFADKSTLSAEVQKYVDGTGTGVDTNYKFDFQTKGLDSETFNNKTGVADYPNNNTEGINVAYNTTDKRTYFIVVSVTNNGDNIISAQSNTLDLTSANTETQSINKISSLAKGETGKIVFALMLDDITKSVDDAGVPFEYIITLQNGEIANPIATFSYLNNDNEFTVDETKTQVLTKQIYTDPNFELDDAHFDTAGVYLYNFQLSDIDTSNFNNVQITFSTSNSFMIIIAPKCYANFQDLMDDPNGSVEAVMGESTASAYYDLTEATPLNFCICIGTGSKVTESKSGYNLEISISKSFTEGEFRYFAINKDTEWIVGPKDETISGNNGEITIPKTFQDKPVVGLQPAMGLFNKCSNIKKIIIQDNIKEIPMGCFTGSGIQEIVLGSAIELIGGSEFQGCSSLTSITIPSSVKSIGDSAFDGCSSLTSITIPSSVTSIGSYAFHKCSSLTSINIPSSVTSIGDRAFFGCSSLTSVTFEEGSSLTSIEYETFQECSSLTSITIPSSVRSIEGNAFSYCSSLKSIEIPSSVTSIGEYAFFGCSGLISITIPEGVTSIGSSAFQNCSSLASITIPSSVTSIGRWAFLDCSSLKTVYITDLAKWCGISFGDSSSNPLNNGANLYLNERLVTDLVIPSSVTSIGDDTFCNCSSLTSVTIASSVTSIGFSAFDGCSSLTSITIPSSVTSIGNSAFSGCSSLATINFTGTQAQWNAISGLSNASIRTGVKVVCTDGPIVIAE